MKKSPSSLGLLFAVAAVASAAPLSINLGQGLAYHRIHQLPGDLPTEETARLQPCILDVRYVAGDTGTATALVAWLKFHATAHAPVFVLVNSDTSAALKSVISHGAGESVVVLGAAAGGFKPDIALKISAEDERRAYDAFEHGATADSLIAENPDKPRNDEAKLARDRQTDPLASDDSAAAATVTTTASDLSKPKLPPPLVDTVLQRAVQLHRALLALKKI